MRKRLAVLILIVLVASLLPVHVMRAQEPLDLRAYSNRITSYLEEVQPLLDQLSASLSALRVDHTLANNLTWRVKLTQTAKAYRAANAPMYEIVPVKYLTDVHLYFIASLGYTDAALALEMEFARTKDLALLDRIDVLRGNSGVAWDRFVEMYGYFTGG